MSMTEAEEIALLLKSAIPIDDVDQMLAPGLSFAIIWIDISERPDLQALAEKDRKYALFLSFCDQRQPGKQRILGACKHCRYTQNLSPPGAFVTKPLRISPKGLLKLFSKLNRKRSILYKHTVSHSIITPIWPIRPADTLYNVKPQ